MEDFLGLCRSTFEQKAKIDEMQKIVDAEKKIFGQQQAEILRQMEALELEKQHIKGFGTIFQKTERSVKVPKTVEEKLELFAWIKDNKGEDVLNRYLTINSRSLNSFYKEELEIAKEEGNVNFKIAGIEEPQVYYKLGMRKG